MVVQAPRAFAMGFPAASERSAKRIPGVRTAPDFMQSGWVFANQQVAIRRTGQPDPAEPLNLLMA